MDNSAFKSILAAAEHTYVKQAAAQSQGGGDAEAKKEKRRKKRPRDDAGDRSRKSHGNKHE